MKYLLLIWTCIYAPQQPMTCDTQVSFIKECRVDTLAFDDTGAMSCVKRNVEAQMWQLEAEDCRFRMITRCEIDSIQP